MSKSDLKKEIPIFPLSNVIFFPKTTLPLNIFEKRYLQMVNDSVSENRLIGMVQPKLVTKDNSSNRAEIFTIGCVGKISSFNETDDGRIILTLNGISRFKVEKELEVNKLYRKFLVNYDFFKEDNLENKSINQNLNDLFNKIKIVFKKQGLELDWKEIGDFEIEELINTISMIAPFTSEEKQTLLEAINLHQRVETLKKIVEIYLVDDYQSITVQ
ncbi:MAG: hypothetical protein CBC24_05380 [Candidatus Pelagibacter sp. TMED64]|nr:ATP-dependent protease [Candidatus Pelagibacter sp.]OUU65558.1 MAG: hypothetical protein CBC24_05380 [Candidatus Pelagibacter sp. TMED64]|tara:strand:+ start:8238 stop:8882 length:645 start_codon:yes stop_codon:yes gene_type:complete